MKEKVPSNQALWLHPQLEKALPVVIKCYYLGLPSLADLGPSSPLLG